MAVSSSPVEIIINVVDGNSGEVISRIEKGLAGVGAAGATTGATAAKSMKGIAEGAGTAGGELKKLEKEFTGGESSLRTMNTEVRSLQGSLYGDSRAAAEFLAMFPKIGAAMELAFPLFGVVAFVGVIGEAVDKGHELYDKYLSLTSAAEKYDQEIAKSRVEDFGNPRSIETVRDRIEEATDNLRMYQKLSERFAHQKPSWEAYAANVVMPLALPTAMLANRHSASAAATKAVEAQGQLDRLQKDAEPELRHQATLEAIDLSHGDNGRLSPEQQIRQALGKQEAINRENRSYQAGVESKLNWADPESGKEEERRKNQIAEAHADAELYKLRRENAHELMDLQNQATNAELHGIALMEAQRKQAIDELKFKYMASKEAVAAVDKKFHEQEKKYLDDELQATKLIEEQAKIAGMTGIQKIQMQGRLEADRINGDSNLTDDAKQARVAAAQVETNAQILQSQREFTEQVDSLAAQSASRQVSGFARIREEESKQLDDLKKKFDDTYGHMEMTTSGAAATLAKGKADYERGQAAIHGDANFQAADLARRNAEETEDIEAQARIRSLSAEKGKTAGIEAAYEERTRKLLEQLNQREIGWKDYNARVAAAGEERDAEMVEAAQAARRKMAMEFDQVFRNLDHPLRALQAVGEKAMSQAAAAMVQRWQMRHGNGSAPEFGAEQHGGFLSSILGLPGLHPSHTRDYGVPAVSTASTHDEAGGKTIALAAAEITIQNANLAFSGAGSTATSYLGGAAIPAASGPTGIASAAQMGIGFAPATARIFGGGFSSSPFGGGFAGGAGSAGILETPPRTTGGVMPAHGNGATGVLGDLHQGMGLFTSAKGLFGGKNDTGLLQTADKDIPNGTLNADGSYTNAGSGGMLQGGGVGANAMGAAGGALGLFGAYEGDGGAGGALGGAMSGMQLGMALGGPVGAAVGAAAGAIFGAIGFGGREKAHVYDLKQVRPRIQTDQLAYNAGSMDYMSAYSDMQALDSEAKKATDAMGPAAKSYYHDTIEKEIHNAAQRFTREEKAGRSQYTATAAQFAIGADYVPRDGFAMIHRGERIMPSDQNERITQALEGGGAMQAASAPSDVHLHFHAHDSKSAMQFFMDNKHVVRSALNASYAENSGGADA